KGLAVGQALEYARQIVDALDAAHERAIVHRDLKPANVAGTSDGRVQGLHFGLAKVDPRAIGDGGAAAASTVAATLERTLLGTAAYMSPEQARGLSVDKRTDIWAFGCVLFEMLAGEAAFNGQTITDTLAAVIDRDPDWSQLPSTSPRRIVH